MSIGTLTESGMGSMTEEQMHTFLTEQGVGILGLATEEVPYLVPLSFGFDGDSSLYFVYLLFGTGSQKETLTDETQQGRFVTYRAKSMHEWQSVSLTGTIHTISDDEWDTLQESMENAWHSDLFASASPMRGVEGYRFDIEDWTGVTYGVREE